MKGCSSGEVYLRNRAEHPVSRYSIISINAVRTVKGLCLEQEPLQPAAWVTGLCLECSCFVDARIVSELSPLNNG